jgi:hypothetical protein
LHGNKNKKQAKVSKAPTAKKDAAQAQAPEEIIFVATETFTETFQ